VSCVVVEEPVSQQRWGEFDDATTQINQARGGADLVDAPRGLCADFRQPICSQNAKDRHHKHVTFRKHAHARAR